MIGEDKATEPVLPFLRRDLEVHPGGEDDTGGKSWLIYDPVSDNYFRIGWREHEIIARLQGGKTHEEILLALNSRGLDCDKSELSNIVSFLSRNHLFLPEYGKTERQLSRERERRRKSRAFRMLSSYLAIRIPLWKPDRFLNFTADFVKSVFNSWVVLILSVTAIWGYIQLFPNWTRLKSTFVSSLNPDGLLAYFIAILAVKFIHELSHAYAAKLQGVRCREFGVAFIIFLPRLYTDLTDSWRITDRKGRMLIDGGGVLVELLIGGLAALLWSVSGDGDIAKIAYFLFTVSIINSILFNGNPLMRFDGYYLLSDFLGVDNLQTKSSKRIKAFFRRWLWGVESAKLADKDHNFLFTFYGISSFIYRFFLYSSIIAIIYYKFTKVLGITLAGIEIYVLLLAPLNREFKQVRVMSKNRIKFYLRFALTIVLPLLVLLYFPIPTRLAFPCELKAKKRSIVYVDTEGFIDEIHVADGKNVKKGEALFTLRNPFLHLDLSNKKIAKDILELELDQVLSNRKKFSRQKIKREQLSSIDSVLVELERKINDLGLKSEIDGKLIYYNENLKPDQWFNQGDALGEVYNSDDIEARAYVKEQDVKKLAVGDEVEVFLEREFASRKGKIVKTSATPLRHLEPTPLQDFRGGPLVGKSGRKAWSSLDVLYLITIKLDDKPTKNAIGRSGIVHRPGHICLGQVLLRKILNFFQKEFVF